MAIYHLTTKHVSRKSGRTATAAAAYRAAAMIHDERTGETHDYRRKRGVLSADCFYIDANGGVNRLDREQVWNAAEQIEKRKDARTAREIVVALPSELDGDERKKLASAFGEWLSKKFGVGVDVALHAPDKGGDDRNFHAHILMTTRKVSIENGKAILGEKSDLELSDRELRKRYGASASGRKLINEIRKRWADGVNWLLEREGIDARIDHRSHAERGLQELPSIKMGVAATAMERRGEVSERGEINRAIKAANAQYHEIQNEIAQAQADERDRITQFMAVTDRAIASTDQTLERTDQRIDRIKRDIEQRDQRARTTHSAFAADEQRTAAAHSAVGAGEQRTAAARSGVAADEQRATTAHGTDESRDEIAARTYRHIDRSARHIDSTAQHIDAAAQHIDTTKQYIDAFNARARETARDIEILGEIDQREVQPVAPEPPEPVIIRLPITASYIPGGFNRPLYQQPTVAIGHYQGYKEFQSALVCFGQVNIDLSTMQIISETISNRYPEQYKDDFATLVRNHAYAFLGRDDQGNEKMGFDAYNNYIKQKHGASFQCHESFHDDIKQAFEYLQRTPPQVRQVQQPHQEHDNSYDYDM